MSECRRHLIAVYLDGDLTAEEERDFELHLAGCSACATELNAQKHLLNALETAFDERFPLPENPEEFTLPSNFARVTAAKAESDFSGVRRRSEAKRAFLIIASLFLFGLLCGAAWNKTEIVPFIVRRVWNVVGVIADFLLTFVYDFGLSFVVIGRAVGRKCFFESPSGTFLFVLILVLSFFAWYLLRREPRL